MIGHVTSWDVKYINIYIYILIILKLITFTRIMMMNVQNRSHIILLAFVDSIVSHSSVFMSMNSSIHRLNVITNQIRYTVLLWCIRRHWDFTSRSWYFSGIYMNINFLLIIFLRTFSIPPDNEDNTSSVLFWGIYIYIYI